MDDNEEKSRQFVDSHVAALAEHFDSVQVFVTRHMGGETAAYQSGSGNWYARLGQIGEWLGMQDARAGEYAIRQDDDED